MILLYGAGGGPGRGEIPMDLFDDPERFIATVDVSVSSTFYSWVFTYAGRIKIVSPASVVEDYKGRLQLAIEGV